MREASGNGKTKHGVEGEDGFHTEYCSVLLFSHTSPKCHPVAFGGRDLAGTKGSGRLLNGPASPVSLQLLDHFV